MRTKKCLGSKSFFFCAGGVALTLIGLGMALFGFPVIVKSFIAKGVALQEGSQGFGFWKEMPLPLQFKVYLFNVTNPKEVTAGERPIVNEVGPYVYDERRVKENIRMMDNDTVSYHLRKIFTFNAEASKPLMESDKLTLLNVALMGVVIKVKRIMPMALSTVQIVIPYLFDDPKDPFLRASVGEFLFGGVFISCKASDENPMVALVCDMMKSKLPPTIRESDVPGEGYYFSMFNNINNTLDGPFSIKAGVVDRERLGEIVSYKNKTTLDEWDAPCDVIRGTDTTIFAPMEYSEEPPKKIYIFQPDVCRGMYADFVGKRTVFGMQAYRFEATESVLAAKKTNPENGCFCDENWSAYRDGCSLSGVQNLEPCQEAPVIASFPHFYLADPVFREYVEDSVEPSKEKHGTYAEIEPKTGTALRGAKRVQFNMEMQRVSNIKVLSSVSPGLFPVIWVEEGAQIDRRIRTLLDGVHDRVKAARAAQWILVAVGLVLATVGCRTRCNGGVADLTGAPVAGKATPAGEGRSAAAGPQAARACFDNPTFKRDESVEHG